MGVETVRARCHNRRVDTRCRLVSKLRCELQKRVYVALDLLDPGERRIGHFPSGEVTRGDAFPDVRGCQFRQVQLASVAHA